LKPEPNQQITGETDQLPENEHHEEIVGEHDAEHREGEQAEAGEVTRVIRVIIHLCHGTAGNGYAFLKLYARFRDAVWLDRARAFAMTAIEQCRAARRKYRQGRYSLWTGDPGVAVYLHDCLRAEARFPTIDIF